MKVAIICVNVSGRGGMESVLSLLINQLNQQNVEAKVFLVGGSSDDRWLETVSHNKRTSVIQNKYVNYAQNAVLLPYDMKRFNPDVIIGANPRAVQLGLYLRKLVHLTIPVGSWMHFSLPELSPLSVLGKADFHIAISQEIFDQFYDLNITTVNNVYQVSNPIILHHKTIPRPPEKAHFVYVGRTIYDGQKRVNDLLNALKKVEGDWELTVIGDGSDKERLIRLAHKLSINDQINWTGWVENPWDVIKEATALVLTSDYEGFGMVLIEAMSYGIPCISSDCKAGPQEIINETNGWLYPKRDIDTLAQILQDLVSNELPIPESFLVQQSIERFDVKMITWSFIDVVESESEKYGLQSKIKLRKS